MSQNVVGVLVFGGLIAAYFVIPRLVSRGVSTIEGAVTGNTRTRGLAAVRLQTDFTVPVPGSALIDKVLSTLTLDSPSSTGLGLRLLGRSPDGGTAILVAGRAKNPILEFGIDTEPQEGGCTGFATAAKWIESDGRVPATDHIERLHKHVRSAVTSLGGQYSESTSN